jgi:hypothetical protein
MTRHAGPAHTRKSMISRALNARAVAAASLLSGTLIASGCGETLGQKENKRLNVLADVYTTNPSEAVAFLAKLTPPAGFAPRCRPRLGPESVCFRRRESMVLNKEVATRLVAELGTTPIPGTISCPIVGRAAVPRLVRVTCGVYATAGPVHLSITVTSLVRASVASSVGTTQGIPHSSDGTVISVADTGTYNARCTNARHKEQVLPGCPSY